MRIGVNTRVLLKHRMEGVARYTYEITKRMVLAHPEDDFIFFFDRDYDDNFLFADNVTGIIVTPQARHPLLWFTWFEISLPKILEEHDIDVFFSPDTYLSLRSDVPTLLTCHDLAYLHFPNHIPLLVRNYYKYYFPKFHKKADHILAVSQSTKDDIVSQYEIEENKITVTFNACSENFKPLNSVEKVNVRLEYSDGKPYFIYVGSIHPRKNIVRLVKAFEKFCDAGNEHRLIILGRWAWSNDVIAYAIKNSKYTTRIKVLNEIEGDISPLLAAAEALVYISLFEGFGLPLLEAMQSEVPVITSNRGALKEIADDAALFVDPENINEIADAMQSLVSDENLVEKLVEAGKIRVRDFSWDKAAADTYDQIKSLAPSLL